MTHHEFGRAFVAVAVSKIGGEHAVSVLEETAPGHRSFVDLGSFDDQHAFEVEVQCETEDHAKSVSQALAGAMGEDGDTALVPSAGRLKQILICDMDSTIIGQECLDELADFAGLKAEVAAITERAMRGELDFEAALKTRVAMLKGLALEALQDCFDTRIRLNAGAATLVRTMREKRAETLLVSGGFTFFTSRVAAEAGFRHNRGNTLMDDGTALTGEVGQPILGKEAKQHALEEACRRTNTRPVDALAMGDGANDLAMIRSAGLGIAYRAKPVVAADADAAINHCDLTAALFFQGIPAAQFAALD